MKYILYLLGVLLLCVALVRDHFGDPDAGLIGMTAIILLVGSIILRAIEKAGQK